MIRKTMKRKRKATINFIWIMMLTLALCLSGCRKNAASDTEDSAESAPAVEPISEEAEETGSPEPETDDGQTEETAAEAAPAN